MRQYSPLEFIVSVISQIRCTIPAPPFIIGATRLVTLVIECCGFAKGGLHQPSLIDVDNDQVVPKLPNR